MADYYEILGVPTDATREDIRTAYRDLAARTSGDDKAKLNRAWNVLSDPYQRGRYDQQLSDGTADDAGGADLDVRDIDDEDLDPRAARAKARAEARAAALIPDPPPPGHEYPAPAQRWSAFGIDIVVLLVLFFVMYFLVLIGGPLKHQLTPAEQKQKDTYTTQIAQAKKDAAQYNDQKDAANKAADAAEKAGDTSEQKAQEAKAKAAGKKADAATKKQSDLEDKKFKLEAPTSTQVAVFAIVTPLLMLAYLLIPSLGRGQTVGKKLRGIRVVSITGGDADFAQLAIRYGLPVVIAVDGFIILQQIAPLLALFGVLMWPRNKRRQGLHDRLAKTVVVDNTIVPGDA